MITVSQQQEKKERNMISLSSVSYKDWERLGVGEALSSYGHPIYDAFSATLYWNKGLGEIGLDLT